MFQVLRCRNARWRRLALALLPPVAAVGALLALMAWFAAGPIRLSTTLLPMLSIVPLYAVLFQQVTKRRLKSQLDQPAETVNTQSSLGEHLITLSPDGVTVDRQAESTFRRWTEISQVVADRDYGYIYTDPENAIIIPQHCFSSDEDFCLFVKEAIIFHWNAESAETPVEEAQAVPCVNESRPAPFIPARGNGEVRTLGLNTDKSRLNMCGNIAPPYAAEGFGSR